MIRWESVVNKIERATGQAFSVKRQQSLAGGSINSAYLLSGDHARYFVKTNATGKKAMFEAEAEGLLALAASNTIKVPLPICVGDDGAQSYLVLQYLELNGRANQVLLGEQLAAMHRITADQFGWEINNTIGATFQPNAWMTDWVEFWQTQRLGFQLQLAAQNGYVGKLQVLGEKLLIEMPKLFSGREVMPSMLHGDLWGGNVAGLNDGIEDSTPVIFDPAFYYGDREADLAMTYVFGGFSADFYASYQNAFPLDEGFAVRKTFYNIYHIVNHLNLFGGGYQQQSIQMLEQVLAEVS